MKLMLTLALASLSANVAKTPVLCGTTIMHTCCDVCAILALSNAVFAFFALLTTNWTSAV